MDALETIQKEATKTKALGSWAFPMAHPEIEGMAGSVPTRCPKCGQVSRQCVRLQWPDLLRRLVGSHPWHCPTCSWRFYLKRRG